MASPHSCPAWSPSPPKMCQGSARHELLAFTVNACIKSCSPQEKGPTGHRRHLFSCIKDILLMLFYSFFFPFFLSIALPYGSNQTCLGVLAGESKPGPTKLSSSQTLRERTCPTAQTSSRVPEPKINSVPAAGVPGREVAVVGGKYTAGDKARKLIFKHSDKEQMT